MLTYKYIHQGIVSKPNRFTFALTPTLRFDALYGRSYAVPSRIFLFALRPETLVIKICLTHKTNHQIVLQLLTIVSVVTNNVVFRQIVNFCLVHQFSFKVWCGQRPRVVNPLKIVERPANFPRRWSHFHLKRVFSNIFSQPLQ